MIYYWNKLLLDLSLNKYVTAYFLDYLENWYHIDKKVNVQHVEQDPDDKLHVIHLNYFHFDNWLSNDLVTTINNNMKNRFHSLLCSNIMALNYFHHKHWPMRQVQEESKHNFLLFFCSNRKLTTIASFRLNWADRCRGVKFCLRVRKSKWAPPLTNVIIIDRGSSKSTHAQINGVSFHQKKIYFIRKKNEFTVVRDVKIWVKTFV